MKIGTLPFYQPYVSNQLTDVPFGIEIELYPYGYRTFDDVYDMLFKGKDVKFYWQMCYSEIQAENTALIRTLLNGVK